MLKKLTLIAGILFAGPVMAQNGGFTTTNDVVNGMMQDWGEYDAACRGLNPSQGADRFCAAREYIGWALNQSGVCLADDENTGRHWEACKEGSYEVPDPLADIRDQL